MERGSFTGDFEGKVQKKALERDAYCLRDPLGNLGSPLTGNLRGGWRAPGREKGDLEGYGEEGSGDEHVRSWGTLRDS